MLTYHPDGGLYVAGTYETGYTSIDKDSQAYIYCEYLRSKFGSKEAKNLFGDTYYVVNVSEDRVEQIKDFVWLEYSMLYLMDRGL